MYFTDISNEELVEFHNLIKVSAKYDEIDENSKLFIKEGNMKLISLFYFDKITANDNITILDDLIALYVNEGDLNSIYYSSNCHFIKATFWHEYRTVNENLYLILHFYEESTNLTLANFEINVVEKGGLINGNYVTDDYGNLILKPASSSNEIIITSLLNGEEIKGDI